MSDPTIEPPLPEPAYSNFDSLSPPPPSPLISSLNSLPHRGSASEVAVAPSPIPEITREPSSPAMQHSHAFGDHDHSIPSAPPKASIRDASDPHSPPSRFGTPSGSLSMRRRTGRLPSPIQPIVRPHSHNGHHPYVRPAAYPHHQSYAHGSMPVIRRANLSSDIVTPVTAQFGAQRRIAHWRETQQTIAGHMTIDHLPSDTQDGIVFDPRTAQPRAPYPWLSPRHDAEDSRSIQQMINNHRQSGIPLGGLDSPYGTQGRASPAPQVVQNITYNIHPGAIYDSIPPPPSISSTGGLLTPLDSAQQKTARPGAHQVLAEQQKQERQQQERAREPEAKTEPSYSDAPLTAPLTSGGAGLLTPLVTLNQKGSQMLRQQRAPRTIPTVQVEPPAPLSAPLESHPIPRRKPTPLTSNRGIEPPLRSATLPSVLRAAGPPPPNHAISPTVGIDGTIVTIDMKTMSIPTPTISPSTKLQDVPKRVREAWAEQGRTGDGSGPTISHRDFAMQKLVEWGQEYYFAPHTADLWILFPYTSKRNTPADSSPSSSHHTALAAPVRTLKRDGIWSKPLPGGVRAQDEDRDKGKDGKATAPPEAVAVEGDSIPYRLNILSYKRLIRVNRDVVVLPGQPSFDYYAVPVHMNYVTPFSLLFSRILHAATGSEVDQPIPRDPAGIVNWQSPMFNGAEMWTTPKNTMRVMYLPIPDPRSFLLLLHWMYFQRTSEIHTCLTRRVASWEGMVENIEYLEMYAEARDLVQSWWDRWIAPSDKSPRYKGGHARKRMRSAAAAARRRRTYSDDAAALAQGGGGVGRRSSNDSTEDGRSGSDVIMDGSELSDQGHEADDEGVTSTGTGIIDRLADQVSSAFSERDWDQS